MNNKEILSKLFSSMTADEKTEAEKLLLSAKDKDDDKKKEEEDKLEASKEKDEDKDEDGVDEPSKKEKKKEKMELSKEELVQLNTEMQSRISELEAKIIKLI